MIDEHSHTWLAVKARAEEIEAESVRAICQRAADPVFTEFERGRLAAARAIIALAAEAPSELPPEDVSY